MASSSKFSLRDLPAIHNISVEMDEDLDPRTMTRRMKIKLTPDWDHLWLREQTNWVTGQEFWIDLHIRPYEMDQFRQDVNAFHQFVRVKTEEGWSAYWESHFGVVGNRISVMNHPDDQFVLGGAL